MGNTTIGSGIGGAMLCGESAVMSVSDCEFRDNSATKGAAVYASPRGLATFERCTFVGNRATNEGGAVCSDARLSVSESSFIGNSSGAQGGALWLQTTADEASQLARCEFLENSAVTGGGAVYAFAKVSMSGTLAAGNRVTASGGGGAVSSSRAMTMTNCTIVGNLAATPSPSARFAGGIQLGGGTATVSNSVVWWNGALPIVSTSQFKLNSCIVEGGGLVGGNLASDPLFADPDGPDNDPLTFGDNDYTLLAGSPAIDGGTNIGLDPAQTADLAGNPRFANDLGMPDRGVATTTLPFIVDIGAYEFQGRTCRADVDRDGSATVDDLFGFLDAWFAQNGSHSPPVAASALTADLDFDLAVGVEDLWVYLDAWFAGCP
jgi:predicted outer membrane repeat protein